MEEIKVRVQTTPNPNALKFIVNRIVKTEGKATFVNRDQCQHVRLAAELFELPGVSQLHFFDNFITVTFTDEIDPERVEQQIEAVITSRVMAHDPNFAVLENEKPKIQRELTPQLEQIEEIFDRTIRPGLRADGGDIETLSLEGNILLVNYQGACGTCPSSAMGTLEAIRGILANEFNPDIEVYIAPTY
jgi:Fe-S cluster biogenesis protein NfuA